MSAAPRCGTALHRIGRRSAASCPHRSLSHAADAGPKRDRPVGRNATTSA
ncbi:hypothetical protein ACFQU2_05210 [Siccirubricoccus deserti]